VGPVPLTSFPRILDTCYHQSRTGLRPCPANLQKHDYFTYNAHSASGVTALLASIAQPRSLLSACFISSPIRLPWLLSLVFAPSFCRTQRNSQLPSLCTRVIVRCPIHRDLARNSTNAPLSAPEYHGKTTSRSSNRALPP